MLPKSYLKVIAACVVFESKLSKTAKTQLIRFIESEASEAQLTVFINTGEIKKDADVQKISEEGKLVPAMIIAAALVVGKKAYDYFKDESRKACAGKEGDQKKICIAQFKAKAAKAKVAALKKEMAKCNRTDDAKKCRNTFMKYIQKYEKQM